ncbi:unnamed protein product [Acidithrix sp. C25]|nr:unnamed protein product [Acidithrix sp. C25]
MAHHEARYLRALLPNRQLAIIGVRKKLHFSAHSNDLGPRALSSNWY